MTGKVSKNMAIGAGVIGFILIVCGFGCAVAGFVWTAYGKGAHGIWSGIFVSPWNLVFPYLNCRSDLALVLVF